MNLEFGLESCALSEQVLGGVEGIVNVHVSVVTTDTLGKILCALSSLLAALLLHTHVHRVEDLVAELLGGFGELIREHSNSLNVFDDLLITSLDSLNYESAHAEYNGGGCTGVDAS